NNPVDINQAGTYIVRYNVCDSDGNKSQEISRVVIVTENQPPQASEVRIEGDAQVGQVLSGTYVYYDPDGDSEGQSLFKWYRADDAEGANKVEIPGANEVSYIVLAEDTGKYIFFEVRPVAGSGISEGTPVLSSAVQVQEGCFIATAAYGSYLDPHVMALRQFRDHVLLSRVWGRKFVSWYYQNSPPVATYIARHTEAKIFSRLILTPLIMFIAYPRVSGLIFILGIFLFKYRKKLRSSFNTI
ncbi:MAG: hypothetical protein PHX14_13185, partial [Syntrophomonadaceae bacterium]|nr:hypothetical protein [Syntrophomonadaceae bacterium]